MDIAEFIAARLDEDEAAANEVHLPRACGCVDRDAAFDPDPNWCGCSYPARVLREVEAKRARLALMLEATAEMDRLLADETAGRVDQAMAIGRARAATVAAKHDAAVYSDHPDYRAEWRP